MCSIFRMPEDVIRHRQVILYSDNGLVQVVVVVYLTLTDPLRIQPWSQDGRNRTLVPILTRLGIFRCSPGIKTSRLSHHMHVRGSNRSAAPEVLLI